MKLEINDAILSDTALCHNIINRDYLDASIYNTENLILEKENDIILGVCLFRIRPTSIYIDMICSSKANRGGGSRMLSIIFEYMRAHKSVQTITLESLPEAIGFYKKKGFRRLDCLPNNLCPMVLMRSDLIPKLKTLSKTLSKTRSKSLSRVISKSKSKTLRRRTV